MTEHKMELKGCFLWGALLLLLLIPIAGLIGLMIGMAI